MKPPLGALRTYVKIRQALLDGSARYGARSDSIRDAGLSAVGRGGDPMAAVLRCPVCGKVWDDDPEVTDCSHCDCGYRIDDIFPSSVAPVPPSLPSHSPDFVSGLLGQRFRSHWRRHTIEEITDGEKSTAQEAK